MTVPGGNRALSPRREGTSPSDGEMPWPESLRGDDAERAKGTDVSGNNYVKQARLVCRQVPTAQETCTFSSSQLRSYRELCRAETSGRTNLLLTVTDSACRPSSGRAAVGHVRDPAKKGRRVDTPVAKEHGNVPSRAWQVLGLALFPVSAPSRG